MSISHLYGLLGYPLGHSFSKKYFTEKFEKWGLSESHSYEQFEIPQIEDFLTLKSAHKGQLKGLNVTIPYKQQIMSLLDEIDPAAAKIGAVNTIKIFPDGKTKGFNTDYWGFRQTIESWDAFPEFKSKKAVVLGQGGAAKAIIAALEDLGITVWKVSRTPVEGQISYEDLAAAMDEVGLIVNSTPLGMYPNIDSFPPIDYHLLNNQHYLYDIVYNPLRTAFLEKGVAQGVGGVYEGLEMLHGQADKAWEIWNA
ncbi:shikimate dehydrogenase family protein [Aquirufa aurantiipilula]|uniref:Shikimate dehydrogenase n=1 Tax=Aquirufa aurantiipilula TaxID=2696561 RepID=A0ABT6BKA5_9BACT|nr:shikimate dehydrogenase [Aquirufa aurantiipilula]MBZ1326090.1 shikimate dehydrogenase [Aquirufa aurantiipilula]MDF5690596.1 shikimate dehydrogenase [Aquirufa aurantiipilula]